MWKLECDILKNHRGIHFGCWFSLHSILFLSPTSDYSKETPCLDCLTRSSSHRTSRFIMPCLVTQLNTERKTCSSHCCHWKVVWLKWVLSVLRLQGSMLGVILAIGLCFAKLWFHPVKAWMCHSETHLGKKFGSLRKTLCVLILSSLPWVMVPRSWLFWRNTDLGSPY